MQQVMDEQLPGGAEITDHKAERDNREEEQTAESIQRRARSTEHRAER